MAENYDLIFGQGASSQYAWSDSDYQNGWKTVGSTPPTAEQFDALQRRSDTKAKDLNNRLSPLETTASKALAKVTPAANRLPYFNSSNSATTTAISDFSKTLLDDKDAATARATLGAPSTTGGGASGTWGINISGNAATATKATSATTAAACSGNAATATKATSATTAAACSGNSATATKLATPRTISLTGNASGSANFDGSGDASIKVTVDESKHAANADAATKAVNDGNGANIANTYLKNSGGTMSGPLNFANKTWNFVGNDCRIGDRNVTGSICIKGATGDTGIALFKSGGFASSEDDDDYALISYNGGNINFNKTIGGNISGNADSATNADKVDGYHENSFLRYRGAAAAKGEDTLWDQIGIKEYSGKQPKGVSGTYDYGAVVSLPAKNTRLDIWYDHQSSVNKDGLWYRSGYGSDQKTWARLLDSNNYTNWAPTKTGAGASGTWEINISGNADSATDADKVDGYHASDLLRTLGGNKTPVITDIFDRAGTIDMSTMSAAAKATDKANINKALNMTQNLWNNSSGIRAYGGDTDMNGYSQGTLKLTQSYKNFDKILVVNSNDDANWIAYSMWDVWELAHAFANSYRFNLLGQGDIYWNLYGTAKHGTTTNYAVSTDTVWSCQKENSGIIAIYGIKF